MEKALVSLLKANNELVASVKKISPMIREDYPSITYEKTGREEDININGLGTGIVRTSFTITTRAKGYEQAKNINRMVKESIGPPFTAVNNPTIYLAVLEDEKENQLLDPDITEVILDYTFHHTN